MGLFSTGQSRDFAAEIVSSFGAARGAFSFPSKKFSCLN
jgi:hypothetical protein